MNKYYLETGYYISMNNTLSQLKKYVSNTAAKIRAGRKITEKTRQKLKSTIEQIKQQDERYMPSQTAQAAVTDNYTDEEKKLFEKAARARKQDLTPSKQNSMEGLIQAVELDYQLNQKDKEYVLSLINKGRSI